jgi:DNA-binding MarR family transcriptional regulator
MITPRFDSTVHTPNLLRICAMLSKVSEAEFSALRDALGVADPALSKYLKALTEAGYVRTSKLPLGGRRHTWVSLTPQGRTAFLGHIAELNRLAADELPPPRTPTSSAATRNTATTAEASST